MENRAVILLVEDDIALRQFVSRLLHSSGYTVLSTNCAAEAINVFTQWNGRISLLVEDIDLGEGISGIRLAERLQSLSPDLRIVAMSGLPEHSAFRAEWHFVSKPFSPADLFRKIEDVLTLEAPKPRSAGAHRNKRQIAVDRRHSA